VSCSIDTSTGKADSLQAYCLRHAMMLVAALPRDDAYSAPWRRSGRRKDGDPANDEFIATIDLIHSSGRCEECPTFPRSGDWAIGPNVKAQRLLGAGCNADAREAADEKFGMYGLPLHISVFDDPRDFDASRILFSAVHTIDDARNTFMNAWPRCGDCPVPAAPPKSKLDDSVDSAVMAALAAHGVPMSVGDLIALKIKGFTKNTSSKTMERLVASGAVTFTTRGPSRFYELP